MTLIWDIDEPAAEVVREIFQMCIDGMGLKAIALIKNEGLTVRAFTVPREGKQLLEYTESLVCIKYI